MRKYNCRNCGAELYFDAAAQKLKCEYCDSEYDPAEYETEEKDTEGANGERSERKPETADADARSTDDSEGELVVYRCSHCGAEIITSKTTVATTCLYCNRAVVLEGNVSGQLKPDYVIPFVKQRQDVEAAYLKLCKSTFLAPKLFKEENTVKKIKGMYIPFWLHSMHAEASLRATAKKYRVWCTGDVEYTEVKSYQIERDASGDFEKIPADALVKMDDNLMDAIEPFDYSGMKPFSPAYLAGYYTERFDEPPEKTKSRAEKRARECMHDQMMEGLDGYGEISVQSERVNYSGEKAEYGMLPVWMMYTEYKGKNYVFGMNGQTGKMIGEIPKDYKKAALVTAGVFAGTQLLMMLFRLIGGLFG